MANASSLSSCSRRTRRQLPKYLRADAVQQNCLQSCQGCHRVCRPHALLQAQLQRNTRKRHELQSKSFRKAAGGYGSMDGCRHSRQDQDSVQEITAAIEQQFQICDSPCGCPLQIVNKSCNSLEFLGISGNELVARFPA